MRGPGTAVTATKTRKEAGSAGGRGGAVKKVRTCLHAHGPGEEKNTSVGAKAAALGWASKTKRTGGSGRLF